jgi:AcrR family transcriptional regulator
MAERGLTSTRIADIAREAGVSSATVHYYFRSKDDVLLAAFRWAGEQLHAGLQALRENPVMPSEHIRRLLQMSVPSDQLMHDEYILWLKVWARVRSHPHFLDECMRMSRLWYEAVLEAMSRGVEEGVFHPMSSVEEICERYVAMAESLAYRTAVGYRDMPPERARSVLARFTAQQLGVPSASLET